MVASGPGELGVGLEGRPLLLGPDPVVRLDQRVEGGVGGLAAGRVPPGSFGFASCPREEAVGTAKAARKRNDWSAISSIGRIGCPPTIGRSRGGKEVCPRDDAGLPPKECMAANRGPQGASDCAERHDFSVRPGTLTRLVRTGTGPWRMLVRSKIIHRRTCGADLPGGTRRLLPFGASDQDEIDNHARSGGEPRHDPEPEGAGSPAAAALGGPVLARVRGRDGSRRGSVLRSTMAIGWSSTATASPTSGSTRRSSRPTWSRGFPAYEGLVRPLRMGRRPRDRRRWRTDRSPADPRRLRLQADRRHGDAGHERRQLSAVQAADLRHLRAGLSTPGAVAQVEPARACGSR